MADNADWDGGSGDAVWRVCLQTGLFFGRGFGVMMVAGMLHGHVGSVPALGFWESLLISAVFSSVAGASAWRVWHNANYEERKRKREALREAQRAAGLR